MLKNFGDNAMKMDKYLVTVLLTIATLAILPGCQKQVETQAPAPTEQAVQKPEELKPAPVVQVSADAPQVAIEKPSVDFGQVGPSSVHKALYDFKNAGKQPLLISNIQSTCGCSLPTLIKDDQRYTVPLQQPVAFEPGQTGQVEVTFTAPAIKGDVTKHLYVVSNDPRNPRFEIEIKADITVQVEVSPEAVELRFDKPNAGMPEITVKSLDGKELSIKSITIPNNVMKIPFDPATRATSIVLKPEVDVKLLDTYSTGGIQIITDHPQSGTLLVRYTALPFIEVNRPRIILQNVEAGVPVMKDVLIRSNYDKPIEIASAASKNGYMEIVDQQKDGNHINLMIKITPPVQTSSARRYITDEMTITLKSGEQVTIRCSGWFKL